MNQVPQTGRGATALLVLLCAVSAAVLFAFRAVELSGMSTGFAAGVAEGWWYFHVHHLLYQPVLRALATPLDLAGCDAVCVGQVHGIFWAVVAIACAFLVVHQLTRSRLTALLAGLLVLVSHNVWVFATQVEPYVPLVGLNALLATLLLMAGPGPWSTARQAAFTALFTFSLFFHQANVFFLVPAAVYLGLTRGRAGLVMLAKITVVAGLVSLGVFVLVYLGTYAEPSVRGFYLWLTYYGVVSDDTHGTWRALLTLDPERLKQTGRSIVATIVTEPGDALKTPVRVGVTLLLAAVFAWNLWHVARQRPGSAARAFVLAWAATFVVFFAWWHADVHKFFLLAVVPILLLVALAASDLARALGQGPAARAVVVTCSLAAITAIGLVNFQRSVLPLTGDGSGIEEVGARLARATPPGCVLYTKRRFSGYLPFAEGAGARTYQMMYMSFHFSRFSEDIRDALPIGTEVGVDACNVIPLDWLSHDDFQWRSGRGMRRAADVGRDGTAGPNWPEFIAWILDVRPAPDGDGVVYDALEIVRAEDGEPFVHIDRRRESRAASLDELLQFIDDAVAGDPAIEAARRQHSRLNRFRNRVFGYS